VADGISNVFRETTTSLDALHADARVFFTFYRSKGRGGDSGNGHVKAFRAGNVQAR
jgi:hypothetical protein